MLVCTARCYGTIPYYVLPYSFSVCEQAEKLEVLDHALKEEIHEEKTHVIGLEKPTILLSSISKLLVFLLYFQPMVRQKPRQKRKDFLPFYQ